MSIKEIVTLAFLFFDHNYKREKNNPFSNSQPIKIEHSNNVVWAGTWVEGTAALILAIM